MSNNPQLGGQFPDELLASNMIGLETLIINDCSFSGTLPLALASSLETLHIGGNNFDGAIPVNDLLQFTSLRSLDIGNISWTDEDPSSMNALGGLSLLEEFIAPAINVWEGSTMPMDLLMQFPLLRRFDLSENGLVGPLPAQLADISSLTGIVLSNNELTGTIPTEYGNLPDM
jgi:Leucine-rich repeat (LRR) protein